MKERGKYNFILNPTAGKQEVASTTEFIENSMKKRNIRFRIHYTKEPLHATELAMNISQKNETIVAVGGDGTLNEIVNGMYIAGAGNTLGILPTGSGNDTIKSLNIQNDLRAAMSYILGNKTKKIDLGRCNKQYFINIMGLGFDGAVMENMEILRQNALKKGKKGEKPSYNRALLKTIFHYRSIPLKVWVDNKKYQKKFFMICIANGTTFGGEFIIAPEAFMDDGKFSVVCINDISILKFFMHVQKVKKGLVINNPDVSYLEGKKIKIISEKKLYAQLDGECYIDNKFDISIKKGALEIFVP